MHSYTRIATIVLIAALLFAGSVAAQNEIVLRLGNDFFAGNSKSDDLYTAGLGFTMEFDRDLPADRKLGRRTVHLEENLFTDREGDIRFDETWLLLGRRFTRPNLVANAYIGGVRVGRGLLGEDLQNGFHRLIGDDEVFLPYVAKDRHFAVVGADVRQVFASRDNARLEVRAEGRLVPEFQQWLGVSLHGHWRLRPWIEIFAGIGTRLSNTQYDALEPWIDFLGTSAEVGMLFKKRWQLAWSHNSFGTDMSHWTLSYRAPLRAALTGGSR